MNPAVLRGREHTVLGAVATIAEGRCAVALSRGGAAKTYPHSDPNEDAVAFAEGAGGILLAAADGHGGCTAAEVGIERLLERNANQWTASDAAGLEALWPTAARSALEDVHGAIVRATARSGAAASVTTLAFAVLRECDDLFAFASIGDSHIFRVETHAASDLAFDPGTPTAFLGIAKDSADRLREKCVAGVTRLSGVRAAVLVTDGISESGIGVSDPEGAVVQAMAAAAGAERDLRPLVGAHETVETALAAHRTHRAGDNVACAVAWLA
ncbi:MAG: protein phosphatase 2C domain-containing protein [Myxococcota bacterium]